MMKQGQRTPMPIRRYTFHGIRFKQEELTFFEDGAVREILQRIAGCTGPESTFGDILDAAFREEIVEGLFAVILKPDEPTLFHRWRNRFRAWRNGIPIDGRAILPHLRNSQVAEVLAGFFDLNTSWMSVFSGFVNLLGDGSRAQKQKTPAPNQESAKVRGK